MSNLAQLPPQSYILTPEGFYRLVVSLAFVGEQNDLIKKAAQQLPYDVRNVSMSMHGKPVHLHAFEDNVVLYTRLPAVRFRTSWRLYDEGKKIFPNWASSAEDIKANLAWVPPEDCAVWFITAYKPRQDYKTAVFAGAWLVAVRKGDAKFYRLPVGNLNDACNICMGGAFRSNESAPYADRMNSELKQFEESEWNADLWRGTEATSQAMFSFSSDGQKQLPVAERWWEMCMAVSARTYSQLALGKLSF